MALRRHTCTQYDEMPLKTPQGRQLWEASAQTFFQHMGPVGRIVLIQAFNVCIPKYMHTPTHMYVYMYVFLNSYNVHTRTTLIANKTGTCTHSTNKSTNLTMRSRKLNTPTFILNTKINIIENMYTSLKFKLLTNYGSSSELVKLLRLFAPPKSVNTLSILKPAFLPSRDQTQLTALDHVRLSAC